jgi:hypothetical protein
MVADAAAVYRCISAAPLTTAAAAAAAAAVFVDIMQWFARLTGAIAASDVARTMLFVP